jgi:poly(ADP-ribose) glycohydrolase ARH3
MNSPIPLPDRFLGCMIGLAVGDALGGLFEGQTADYIARRFPTPETLIAQPPTDLLTYTDDTQMAIGVAEALVERGAISEEALCRAFVANYIPSRGYGRGARAVLDAMEEGEDYRQVAEQYFPGGSFGNGAAMRVAPIGLVFHQDLDRVWEEARLSALPTHLHPLGIEGAQLLAVAVALVVTSSELERGPFLQELRSRCQSDEFRAKLDQLGELRSPAELLTLGNGIRALDSVPTAIGSFLLSPDCYSTTIARPILLGGDTDTIACMAGALSGAYLGHGAVPVHLRQILEEKGSRKGRSYIEGLSTQLLATFASHRKGVASS